MFSSVLKHKRLCQLLNVLPLQIDMAPTNLLPSINSRISLTHTSADKYGSPLNASTFGFASELPLLFENLI